MTTLDVPILEALVHRPEAQYDDATGTHTVGLTGLCAGYDINGWRGRELAEHLLETYLPSFALRYSELVDVNDRQWGRLMRRAARAVYDSPHVEHRGEFGELLLHAALIEVFDTMPAISKIYFKDGPNETVKGFDAVHVLPTPDGKLELWLGEAKFYDDIKAAIRRAIESLVVHERLDYLRREYAAILHKVDDKWPHAATLRLLLHKNRPLRDIFDAVCVPVLLTYDSPVVAAHTERDEAYLAAIREEWERHHRDLAGRKLPRRVKIHLFLVPLHTKTAFLAALDTELRKWQ